MVIWDDEWYLAFREGTSHVDDSAVIRILCSKDGQKWDLFQTISTDNIDLRDPNLSVMSDGTLLLICGATIRNQDNTEITKTYYSKCPKRGHFGIPIPVKLPKEIDKGPWNWLWKLTWNAGVGYGAVYRNDGEADKLTLVKTSDGVLYDFVTELEVGRLVNETRVRIIPDQTMVALMRSGGNGYMGISKPPYTKWEMKQLDIFLAGQEFVFDGTRMVCSTRRRDPEGEKTVVYFGDISGVFNECIEIPSYGKTSDTGYPSIIDMHNDYYISYYSMHETEKPCIYLSRISKGKWR